ncbi:MAG: hemolysin family protein [Acidimicrobiia bacterium]
MSSPWLELGLILVLILINSALAGSEIALISLRDSQVRRLAKEAPGGPALASLTEDPNQYLATIQIGITLAGFMASALAAIAIAEPLAPHLAFMGAAAEPAAVIGTTIVLSLVTLIVGELAPKRLALQASEKWSLTVARPIRVLAVILRPVVWFLGVGTDLVVRFAGGEPGAAREEVGLEELRDLILMHRSLSEKHQEIVVEALELAGRTLHQVRVPRSQVFSLDVEDTCQRAFDTLLDAGHSRAPAAPGRSLDKAVGIVHLTDLVRADPSSPVSEVVREPVILPETLDVIEALHRLQQTRQQMALIVDEHGGIEGIVTIEDLVEEVVGEIYDETDRDVKSVRRGSDGSLVVPGHFPIHDLGDVGVDAPVGNYVTVAGLVLDGLGRVPEEPGDELEIPGWRLRVLAVEGRTITSVAFVPVPSAPEMR